MHLLVSLLLLLTFISAGDNSKSRRKHLHRRRNMDSYEGSFFDVALNKRGDWLSASEDHFSFQFYERRQQSKRKDDRENRHRLASFEVQPYQETIREEKRRRQHRHHRNRREKKTRKMKDWEDSASDIWYQKKDEKIPLRYDRECRQHEGDIVASFTAKESPRNRQATDVLSID